LLKAGAQLEYRDLAKQRLSVAELDKLIGDLDYRMSLNPRNELYRKLHMDKNPPSRGEALKLMAANPNLIRRPVVIRGANVVLGFDEFALKQLIAHQ
jgi:arsenate reductase-like glutaredoxin family protein